MRSSTCQPFYQRRPRRARWHRSAGDTVDRDLVTRWSLLEIAKLLREAGHGDRAMALFTEASARAAAQGETGSSVVADVLVELAHQGEWRTARVTADGAARPAIACACMRQS